MSAVTLDPSLAAPTHLVESDWQARAAAHDARVRVWTDAQQARASRGEKHPVFDFLFSYYSFRPAWLRRWHPGPDIALTGETARAYLRWSEYRKIESGRDVPPVNSPASRNHAPDARASPNPPAVALAPLPSSRRQYVIWLRALLLATQSRPAFFGCYGLHEWAMVYRQTPDEVRHNAHPLRFAPDPLARIVEAAPITCSHFDAFRFFTPPARPLNKLTPARETVPQFEQSGCLHANMDLYKWSFKLAPFAPSELIADCFALARDIREVDMRASPYDLRALGFAPITIETAAGRADYEAHQRTFTTRAEPLRTRLLTLCERLLA
ncbi:MAG: 3-methyladenine DNA glycosylase [Opitutia bacterium]|nr:MAG: 3-methyladenine DNA glycosylase [Opitutae bacterium]